MYEGHARTAYHLIQALLIGAVLVFSLLPRDVVAADFVNRYISVASGIAGATTTHNFGLTYPTTAVVGSMEFEYCTNSPFVGMACTAPAGLNLSASSLASQTGNVGFSIDIVNSTSNRLVLTRIANPGLAAASSYSISGVVNPSTVGQTVYVRIATFTSTDGTGARNDSGAVAFATTGAFLVDAFVPPYLTFCVGVVVDINCQSTAGNLIDLGELSTAVAKVATTQFSGATNDPTGYAIYVTGSTMTSGNTVIPPLLANAGSNPGTSQFGINLRSNNLPTGGAEPVGLGTTAPSAPYSTQNSFRYVEGEAVAASNLSTDFRRLTVTYLVNISSSQPAGFYSSTFSYTAVAAF